MAIHSGTVRVEKWIAASACGLLAMTSFLFRRPRRIKFNLVIARSAATRRSMAGKGSEPSW